MTYSFAGIGSPPLSLRYLGQMSHVFAWIAQYGYGAIFLLLMLGVVGLPVPDETLLVYCGYLISKGVMHPAGAYIWHSTWWDRREIRIQRYRPFTAFAVVAGWC